MTTTTAALSHQELEDFEIVEWARQQHVRACRPGAPDILIDDLAEAKGAIVMAARRLARLQELSFDDLHEGLWDYHWRNAGRRRSMARRAPEWSEAEWRKWMRSNFTRECFSVARNLVEKARKRRGAGGIEAADWWTHQGVKVMLGSNLSVHTPQPLPMDEIGERDPMGRWVTTVLTWEEAWAKTALTDEIRETLVRRFVEGYEVKHVAFQLGIDERTVRKRCSRGLDLLCEYLNGGPAALFERYPATPQQVAGPIEAWAS